MIGTAQSAWRGVRLVARNVDLARKGRIVRMPVAAITDEFAFSLADTGWHPFVEALRNGTDDPLPPIEETRFGRFFLDDRVNAVRNLNDLLDLTNRPAGYRSLPPFWLGTYPWGGLPAEEIGREGPAFGWAHDETVGVDTADRWGRHRTLWHRPADLATLSNERRLTIELYRSIRRRYSPVRARGLPRVTILQRGDGRSRGVIVDGHHRLAILAYLDVRTVLVEVEAVIDEAEADTWYHVRTGHCSAQDARRFFDAFFLLDGSERFELIGGRRGVGHRG